MFRCGNVGRVRSVRLVLGFLGDGSIVINYAEENESSIVIVFQHFSSGFSLLRSRYSRLGPRRNEKVISTIAGH